MLMPLVSIMLAAAVTPAASGLSPALHEGDRLDNVFSRTVSFQAEGFDETVRRVSGSASYRVVDAAKPAFHIDYRYDGIHAGGGAVEFRDAGATQCFDGKCAANTDGSGLLYNPRLWGTPPGRLVVGQHWTVAIAEPWELGTPGTQTVTVVAVDAANHSVTLKREGRGEGAYFGDRLKIDLVRAGKTYTVDVEPSASHWYGYTTFRDGVVAADELMVERPVTLVSKELGRIAAKERQYILLNAMPTS